MLGNDLKAFAKQIAIATGLSVVADPRELVLPGVLLQPGTLEFDRLGSNTASSRFELWLIVGDIDPTVALNELGTMLATIREAMNGAPTSAEPITFTIPSQGAATPLPGLRCPIDIELEIEKETTP